VFRQAQILIEISKSFEVEKKFILLAFIMKTIRTLKCICAACETKDWITAHAN
jgi:hypothetical protein